jgi:hypothetical protein
LGGIGLGGRGDVWVVTVGVIGDEGVVGGTPPPVGAGGEVVGCVVKVYVEEVTVLFDASLDIILKW